MRHQSSTLLGISCQLDLIHLSQLPSPPRFHPHPPTALSRACLKMMSEARQGKQSVINKAAIGGPSPISGARRTRKRRRANPNQPKQLRHLLSKSRPFQTSPGAQEKVDSGILINTIHTPIMSAEHDGNLEPTTATCGALAAGRPEEKEGCMQHRR